MVMSDMIHFLSAGYIEQSGTAIDLYSKPRTIFAATFIGNYTILTAEDFGKAVNEKLDCKDVAIRPEIIHVDPQPEEGEDKYHLQGTIFIASHMATSSATMCCAQEFISIPI